MRFVRVDRSVLVVLEPVPIRPRRRDGFMNGIAGTEESLELGLPLRREAPGGRSTVATVYVVEMKVGSEIMFLLTDRLRPRREGVVRPSVV